MQNRRCALERSHIHISESDVTGLLPRATEDLRVLAPSRNLIRPRIVHKVLVQKKTTRSRAAEKSDTDRGASFTCLPLINVASIIILQALSLQTL